MPASWLWCQHVFVTCLKHLNPKNQINKNNFILKYMSISYDCNVLNIYHHSLLLSNKSTHEYNTLLYEVKRSKTK